MPNSCTISRGRVDFPIYKPRLLVPRNITRVRVCRRRHAHILHKRAEASSQVVLDLDGKDLDNLGELGDMADGELQDDDSRSPLLVIS